LTKVVKLHLTFGTRRAQTLEEENDEGPLISLENSKND
jgi:hypothetical protein